MLLQGRHAIVSLPKLALPTGWTPAVRGGQRVCTRSERACRTPCGWVRQKGRTSPSPPWKCQIYGIKLVYSERTVLLAKGITPEAKRGMFQFARMDEHVGARARQDGRVGTGTLDTRKNSTNRIIHSQSITRQVLFERIVAHVQG